MTVYTYYINVTLQFKINYYSYFKEITLFVSKYYKIINDFSLNIVSKMLNIEQNTLQ